MQNGVQLKFAMFQGMGLSGAEDEDVNKQFLEYIRFYTDFLTVFSLISLTQSTTRWYCRTFFPHIRFYCRNCDLFRVRYLLCCVLIYFLAKLFRRCGSGCWNGFYMSLAKGERRSSWYIYDYFMINAKWFMCRRLGTLDRRWSEWVLYTILLHPNI